MAQIGHGVQRLPNCDLTQRSSRPAFGGRLSLFVSLYMHTLPPPKRISARFKDYNRDMKDVWSSFIFIDFYTDKVRAKVKKDEIEPFLLESLSGKSKRTHEKNKVDTYGVADHIAKVVNPERSFITAVALTEDFLKDIMVTVYEEYPEKMLSTEALESIDRQYKLLDTILAKATKEEIVASLIEEKVRGIFYGNPIDYFTKDKKTKLGFGNYFEKNHSLNLKYFAEITARRNLFAHNRGRVDAKYLREVENPTLKAGQKAVIEKEYLRHTIIILRGLASVAAMLVNTNIFKHCKKSYPKTISYILMNMIFE